MNKTTTRGIMAKINAMLRQSSKNRERLRESIEHNIDSADYERARQNIVSMHDEDTTREVLEDLLYWIKEKGDEK